MENVLAVVVQRDPSKAEADLEIERVQSFRGHGQLHQREAARQRIADLRVSELLIADF